MSKAARDGRVEAIQTASRRHPLLEFVLSSLEPDDDTLLPLETLSDALVEKLKALGDPDGLLAATLGLADLAFVLGENHGSFEASEVILQALGKVQPQIDAAVATLPAGNTLATALGKDAFGAAKPKSAKEAPKGEHVSNAGFDLTASPKRKR